MLRKHNKRDKYIVSKYKITMERLLFLRSVQRGRCGCCKKSVDELSLVPDHNHETGFVRGLVCSACNFIMGHAKDNPTILRQVADFLEQPINLLIERDLACGPQDIEPVNDASETCASDHPASLMRCSPGRWTLEVDWAHKPGFSQPVWCDILVSRYAFLVFKKAHNGAPTKKRGPTDCQWEDGRDCIFAITPGYRRRVKKCPPPERLFLPALTKTTRKGRPLLHRGMVRRENLTTSCIASMKHPGVFLCPRRTFDTVNRRAILDTMSRRKVNPVNVQAIRDALRNNPSVDALHDYFATLPANDSGPRTKEGLFALMTASDKMMIVLGRLNVHDFRRFSDRAPLTWDPESRMMVLSGLLAPRPRKDMVSDRGFVFPRNPMSYRNESDRCDAPKCRRDIEGISYVFEVEVAQRPTGLIKYSERVACSRQCIHDIKACEA